MSNAKFPITGEALAHAAKDYIDTTYEQVRDVLEWRHLPRGMMAIWENSPMMAAARKNHPVPIAQFRDMSQVIVTFPGSTAVDRMREILIVGELISKTDNQQERAHEIATELFTLCMRYTRVQNLARHIRTAVNSHLRILNIETSRERSSLSRSDKPSLMSTDSSSRERIHFLLSMRLEDEQEVDDWAEDVNEQLARQSLDTGSKVESQVKSELRKRGVVAPGALTSYKLRFKQALAATLDLDIARKNTRTDRTSNKSIAELLLELEEMPDDMGELYKLLEELRPKRISRPDASIDGVRYEMKMFGNDNSKKSTAKHVLSLDGRELVIEGSRGAFTAEMISGVMKTIGMQLSIDPDARELAAAFESGGQMLRVRIERPKATDQKKIAAVLAQLI